MRSTITAVAAAVLAAQAQAQTKETKPVNPYMEYTTPFVVSKAYSKRINNPIECYGKNLEIFEQLQSPEWQLCLTGAEDAEELHMCSTENPTQLLLHWMVNDVQEDSFQLDLRRKTKWVDTNFFYNTAEAEYYTQKCPIDNAYVNNGPCSGSYVNGSFNFYPPFSKTKCQCKALTSTKTDDFDPNAVLLVRSEPQKVSVSGVASPCSWLLMNQQREFADKPNIWSEMNSKQINIKVTKMPDQGELYLFGSFHPDFWLNQPKTNKYVVKKVGTDYSFKSTDEVWVMAHCKNGATCPGAFEFEYQIISLATVEDEFPDWSMIITIYIGFSLMLFAFLYFEWRTLLRCMKSCQEKGCGKKQSQIGFIHEGEFEAGKNKFSEGSQHDSGNDELDDQVINGLDRLNVNKKKNVDNSYGEPQVGFDEYASNRQD